MDKNKLILPVAIIVASIVLGGFIYMTQVSKQQSIEKQLQLKLDAEKTIAEEIAIEEKQLKEEIAIEEKQLKEEKQLLAEQEKLKEELEKIEKAAGLDNCLADAEASYTYSWEFACQSGKTAAEKEYDDCIEKMSGVSMDSAFGDPTSFCNTYKFDIENYSECKLPLNTGNRIENELTYQRDKCYELHAW